MNDETVILESCIRPYQKCHGYFDAPPDSVDPDHRSNKVNHFSACSACFPLVMWIDSQSNNEWRHVYQYRIIQKNNAQRLQIDFLRGPIPNKDELNQWAKKYNFTKVTCRMLE